MNDQNSGPVPTQPKIYHILHVDNLASVVADGCLWADSAMAQRQGGTVIGMGRIKQRRLRLPVSCHQGLAVGDCVPFYFCSRSIMLFVIHRANDPELAYRGGQQPIVHLEADLHRAVQWAAANGRRWAFSLSNAGAVYTKFRSRPDELDEINWAAIAATDFRPADVKEGKQAEFLVERSFPWSRFDRVGALVDGFETPFGLELLATVHWVATREHATDAEDATGKVYAWSDRKRRFSPHQIGIAYETLRAGGWLSAA